MSQLSKHKLNMHNTNKGWVCDCCGSRFGLKHVLKGHMMSHLPLTFFCSECDKKFVRAGDLKNHKKRHQGILNEICKLCNKRYATKSQLNNHIVRDHFAKFNCEVTGCPSFLSCKSYYKFHLKTVHKRDDQVLIESLLINLQKLKPNLQQLKYV